MQGIPTLVEKKLAGRRALRTSPCNNSRNWNDLPSVFFALFAFFAVKIFQTPPNKHAAKAAPTCSRFPLDTNPGARASV